MKIVRQSMWRTPDDEMPVTMVMREGDLKNLEEAWEALQEPLPGVFVSTEIFEMPDGASATAASFEALRRLRANMKLERNQAMYYYFTVAASFPRCSPGGTIFNTVPHPMTAPQIEMVLRQLGKHPAYRHQTICGFGTDNKMVRYKDGTVTVEDIGRNE